MSAPIPDAALEQHVAIVGKTGSGKSYAAQGIVEVLIHRGERVCIIDPTDRYWGLRLQADGKKPSGFEPVIFGGQYADMPLSAAHGAAIAEIAGTTTTPIILATRLMTVGERTRFFTDFAETLLRKNQGPLHLVIDEAHLFMPQAGARVGGAAPAMLHAGNNLVSLGRGIGLRIMLLSQRPAKIHKDALTQAETLVAFRLIAPQDRNAIREWVREWADEATGADMMSSLPSLPTGSAWIWAPELDVLKKAAFPTIVTYDSGKPLAAGGKGPALKSIDLAAVRGQLETVAKEAIESDPRRLKARIAELERALSKAPVPAARVSKADLEAAEQRGYERGRSEGHLAGMAEVVKLIRPAIEKGNALIAAGAELAGMLRDIAPALAAPVPEVVHIATSAPLRSTKQASRPVASVPAAGRRGPGPAAAAGSTAITAPQQRIIDALAWWRAIGVSPASRVQVALVARYSPSSGGFNNLLGSLRTAALIDYPSTGMVELTATGAALSNAPAQPPTTGELHDLVYEVLSQPQRRILRAVIEAYPDSIDRGTLGERTEYSATSGGFNNLLGSLRSLKLIDYPAPGQVCAQPVLFIDGER